MKQTNRQIRKQVKELQKTIELADFYAFMLRDPNNMEAIDDQTIQYALVACVNGQYYSRECQVYSTCQLTAWRRSLLT